MIVESGPDVQHHYAGQFVAVIGHPTLLLGTPDSNEYHLGSGRADTLDHHSIFFRCQSTKRRRESIDNLDSGKARPEVFLEHIQHFVAPAVKKNAVPAF